MIKTKQKAIIFDLDGTLLDTAPDLAYALNALLTKNNRLPLAFDLIRPVASHGASALIKLGFTIDENHPNFLPLREQFLALYSQYLCYQTQLFPGMQKVLDHITANNLIWGIVTNKPDGLTKALLSQLKLLEKAGCIVCGDTLAKRKPDPEPLWHACELLNCDPKSSFYVGDAENDIIAAKRAGMKALLAMYGYIGKTDAPATWEADDLVQTPEDILRFL